MIAPMFKCVHTFLDGSVWELTPHGAVRRAADDVEKYSVCPMADYRVLGSHHNYVLLMKLLLGRTEENRVYARRPVGVVSSLFEGMVLSWLATSHVSDTVFPNWSDLVPVDALTYDLLASYSVSNVSVRWQTSFVEHPLYDCFQFLTDRPGAEWVQLMSVIVDPRWFVSWSRPERLTQLRRYFGLRPGGRKARRHARFELLRACADSARQGENRGQIAKGERGMAQVLQFVAMYWLGWSSPDFPGGIVFDSLFLPAVAVSKLKETFHA